jgi:hypothetical protein
LSKEKEVEVDGTIISGDQQAKIKRQKVKQSQLRSGK